MSVYLGLHVHVYTGLVLQAGRGPQLVLTKYWKYDHFIINGIKLRLSWEYQEQLCTDD